MDIIMNEFCLAPLKKGAFNETIKETIEDRRVFNSKYLYRVPQDMKDNIDFFSSLMIVGITPMAHVLKPVFSPHCDRFHLLQGVVMRGTHKVIVNFDVPEVNDKLLHANIANSIMNYDGVKVVGKGDRLLYRVREELGGVKCIVFGVNFGTEYHYYMWDVDSIYRVEASGPATFERCGNKLYLLSDVKDYQIDLEYEVCQWEVLSDVMLDAVNVGIVVSIDADEYKIPKSKVVIVRVLESNIWIGDQKLMKVNPEIDDGNYEMLVEDCSLLRKVDDRRAVCSFKDYEIMRNSVLEFDKIRDFFLVQKIENLKFFSSAIMFEGNNNVMLTGDGFNSQCDSGWISTEKKVEESNSVQKNHVIGKFRVEYDKGKKRWKIPLSVPPVVTTKRGYSFIRELNSGRILIPSLVEGEKMKLGIRQIRIRNYVKELGESGERVSLPLPGSWRLRYEYWKNGKCYNLLPRTSYWSSNGLSNFYKFGYSTVAILSDNVEVQARFECGGLCVLYYDPYLWEIDDKFGRTGRILELCD